MTEGSPKNSSESIQHHLIKNYFQVNIPKDNDVKNIQEEIMIGKRIADVLVEFNNGIKVAIEIQHSRINQIDIIKRTRDYGKENCHVLWILNGESHYRYPKIEHVVVQLKSEKYLQRMYKGRVYYTNASQLGMKNGVYSLHFCRVQEKVQGYNGMSYFRQSKTRRSVIPGLIPSLKLMLYQHMGFKLAMFTDENVRRQCIDSLKEFLRPLDKLNDAVLYDILNTYKDKFGLYLLYESLKHLNVTDKKQFPKMFNFNDVLERNEKLSR